MQRQRCINKILDELCVVDAYYYICYLGSCATSVRWFALSAVRKEATEATDSLDFSIVKEQPTQNSNFYVRNESCGAEGIRTPDP